MRHEYEFSGQKRKYGDYYESYKIFTDGEDKQTVLNYCQTKVKNGVYPEKEEFFAKVYSNEKTDLSYYFHGYYTLDKTDLGYLYTICKPNTD